MRRIGKDLFRCALFWLFAMTGQAAAQGEICGKNGLLTWPLWLEILEQLNPGIMQVELFDPARDRLLKAYNCAGGGGLCPPDRVFAFYCTGNENVLFVFEKDGCVTLTEELPVERFRSIVEGSLTC